MKVKVETRTRLNYSKYVGKKHSGTTDDVRFNLVEYKVDKVTTTKAYKKRFFRWKLTKDEYKPEQTTQTGSQLKLMGIELDIGLVQEVNIPYLVYDTKGLVSLHTKGELRFVDGTWEDILQGKKVNLQLTDEGARAINEESISTITKQFASFNVQVDYISLGSSSIVVDGDSIEIDMTNSEYVIKACK